MAGLVMARNLGKLSAGSSVVLVCDIQEKFRSSIQFFPEIVSNSYRVLQAAQIMQVPILATEQYPKGLGNTVAELQLQSQFGVKPFEKSCFSMAGAAGLTEQLRQLGRQSLIICGIEAHACIYHTVLDFMGEYDVHVVADCCSSRSLTDRKFALDHLARIGAFLTTSERFILSLTPDAAHPSFKQIQNIVKHPAADTGLL